MKLCTYISAFIVCHILFSGGFVHSEESPGNKQEYIFDNASAKESKTEEAEKLYHLTTGENPVTGSTLIYLPPGDLYPPYAADPVRVGFGIQPVHVSKVGIAQVSDSRINLRTGAQVGLVRSQSVNDPDLGWQVNLVGGLNDQNDIRSNLDNIGWDGRYGLLFTMAPVQGWAFKLGLLHVSSHLGDEYIENTGRKRISYTRQEFAAGVSRFVTKRWRLYTEAGRGFSMSSKLQEPWRTQFGIEYESQPKFWRGRMSWYAATDLQSFQERDWRVDVAVQTGFVVRSGGRTWRAGVDWYNGRPPIGEFFQDTERYLSIGVWIDI